MTFVLKKFRHLDRDQNRLRSPLQELRQISRDTICKFLIYPFELISFKISIKIKNLSFARFRSVIRSQTFYLKLFTYFVKNRQ